MYELALSDEGSLVVETAENVFYPTHTSKLCVQALEKVLNQPVRLLDLGCGCGIVGLAAHTAGHVAQLYASDVSEHAVKLTQSNAAQAGVEITARCGSLFEPWSGMTFDCIMDDVSGIAEDVANLSPWFSEHIPCAAGEDGAALTCRVIAEAQQYLCKGGMFLFPIISLSNVNKILADATRTFSSVQKVASQSWMLPPNMLEHQGILASLRDKGMIDYEERFGTIVCWTSIYCCT